MHTLTFFEEMGIPDIRAYCSCNCLLPQIIPTDNSVTFSLIMIMPQTILPQESIISCYLKYSCKSENLKENEFKM